MRAMHEAVPWRTLIALAKETGIGKKHRRLPNTVVHPIEKNQLQ
jgi:hypothetical protein